MSSLVSVVMPVYNCEKYILQAASSILQQSYSNLELIIVDDSSIDATVKIVESLADSRVRIYKNPYNQGPSASLNIAIKLARGEYIAVMHGDDIAIAGRIEKQVKYLGKEKAIDIIGGQYVGMDKDGNRLNEKSSFPLTPEKISYSLLFANVLCHPTVMMRKDIFKNPQIHYNEAYRLCEDYEFWTRAISNGFKLANLREPLIQYRRHGAQASQISSQRENEVFAKIRNEYRRSFLDFSLSKIEELELNNIINIAKEVKGNCKVKAGRKILLSQLIMNLHKRIKHPLKENSFNFKQYLQLIRVAGVPAFDLPIMYQLIKRMFKQG